MRVCAYARERIAHALTLAYKELFLKNDFS